jgi:hypothetical protein
MLIKWFLISIFVPRVKPYVQCNICLKWRKQEYRREFLDIKNVPSDTWCCENSNDGICKSCNYPEILDKHDILEFKPKQKIDYSNQPSASTNSTAKPKQKTDYSTKPTTSTNSTAKPKQSIEEIMKENFARTSLSNSTNKQNEKKRDLLISKPPLSKPQPTQISIKKEPVVSSSSSLAKTKRKERNSNNSSESEDQNDNLKDDPNYTRNRSIHQSRTSHSSSSSKRNRSNHVMCFVFRALY